VLRVRSAAPLLVVEVANGCAIGFEGDRATVAGIGADHRMEGEGIAVGGWAAAGSAREGGGGGGVLDDETHRPAAGGDGGGGAVGLARPRERPDSR